MRQCEPCQRPNLADTDEICPSCHGTTTPATLSRSAATDGAPAEMTGAGQTSPGETILRLLVLAGGAYLAHRLAKTAAAGATEDLADSANRIIATGQKVTMAQVNTRGALQWPNVYKW